MENLSLEVLKPQFWLSLESKDDFAIDERFSVEMARLFDKRKAKRKLVDNFTQECDYTLIIIDKRVSGNQRGGSVKSEQIKLTVDCFKSFCMLAPTEQGKKIRLWYIQIEKEWRELKAQQPKSNLEALVEVVNQLVDQERRQKQLEAQLALEASRVDRLVELVEQHDAELDRVFNPNGGYFSILGYAKLKGFSGISTQEASRLGRMASQLCKKMGLSITKVRDARYGEVGTYPESVLKSIFSS